MALLRWILALVRREPPVPLVRAFDDDPPERSLAAEAARQAARQAAREYRERLKHLRAIDHGHKFDPRTRRCACQLTELEYRSKSFTDHEQLRLMCPCPDGTFELREEP